MYCHQCGSKLPGADLKFCPFCGTQQKTRLRQTQTYGAPVEAPSTVTPAVEQSTAQRRSRRLPTDQVRVPPIHQAPDLEAGPVGPRPDELARTISVRPTFLDTDQVETAPAERSRRTRRAIPATPHSEANTAKQSSTRIAQDYTTTPTIDAPVLTEPTTDQPREQLDHKQGQLTTPPTSAQWHDSNPSIPNPREREPLQSQPPQRSSQSSPSEPPISSNTTKRKFSETAWFMAVQDADTLAEKEGVALDYATADRMTEKYANDSSVTDEERRSYSLRSDEP